MTESDHTQPLSADPAAEQPADPTDPYTQRYTEREPTSTPTSTLEVDPPPTHDTSTAGSRGRHPVNVGHLVMGIAFVSLFVVWGLISLDVVEGSDIRWLMPVPWVLAGLAGLVATMVTARRRGGW